MKGNTNIGDVFVVRNKKSAKYFQYITSDVTQLNSDVIRAFKREYDINNGAELLEIVSDDVDFFAHCITKLGISMGHWEFVGNIKQVGFYNDVLFRDTTDYGNPDVKISEKWWVWKINEPQRYIGKLSKEYQHAEIGLVMNPNRIVRRINTGDWGFKNYPKY